MILIQFDISGKDMTIQMKDASAKSKDSEIKVKTRYLEERDATISEMSLQLTKTREYLANKQQVSIY